MRGNQRDHAVATEPKPVHPVGQPISASTNSGFKLRRVPEVSSPPGGIVRTWRPRSPLTGVFARLVAPSLWSRAVGVIQRLAWFASPTVTFLPSGVLPVLEVPGGIERPPPGVSGVIQSRVASQSVIPS
jgi:hypothetical protein